MKKTGIFFLAFMMITGYAWSQAEVAIGLKGGLNFASLNTSGTVASNYDSRTGYHIGAFALFKFTKFAIQPEVLFSEQGSKVTYSGQPSVTTNFQYVNVPIMLKFYLAGGLNLQAGPQFGFLSNSPTVQSPSGSTVSADIKNSDISLGLGVGWDLPMRLSLEGRYNMGLKDINNSASSTATIKNQVFMISVGFKLFKFGS